MIHYALHCASGHGFEAWFASSAAFETQADAGHVTCPVCDDRHIVKAPMAPRIIHGQGEARQSPAPLPATPHATGETMKMIAEFCRSVEANCDYVGQGFPEEARKIHYGETDPRPIYGEATPTEATALKEEGIAVAALPWVKKPDA
jgi:hypothetical protein